MTVIITATGNTEARTPSNEPALVCRETALGQSYHYWLGASGKRYLHTVFSLVDCPSLPKVNYVLAHCGPDGIRRPLDVGQTSNEADSLNLAQLRHKAARLGANEVHVHFLPETSGERRAVEVDLGARQLGRTVGRKTFSPANDSGAFICA